MLREAIFASHTCSYFAEVPQSVEGVNVPTDGGQRKFPLCLVLLGVQPPQLLQ